MQNLRLEHQPVQAREIGARPDRAGIEGGKHVQPLRLKATRQTHGGRGI